MNTQFDFFSQMSIDEMRNFFRDEQEESATLEFKTGDVSMAKIFKEVSAFANTDGGVIIVGAPKEVEIPAANNSKERRKMCKGDLEPSTEDMTNDVFLQKLQTGITPAVMGVKIKRIEDSGRYMYVIGVPKSMYSPHQVAAAGTYYVRVGTMSSPAPHGLVEALFNKVTPIKLETRLKFEAQKDSDLYVLSVGFTNGSDFPALDCGAFVVLTGNVSEHPRRGNAGAFEFQIIKQNVGQLLRSVKFESGLVLGMQLWSTMYNVSLRGAYCYVDVYFWAKDSRAIRNCYKVWQNGEVLLLNTEQHEQEFKERESWVSEI